MIVSSVMSEEPAALAPVYETSLRSPRPLLPAIRNWSLNKKYTSQNIKPTGNQLREGIIPVSELSNEMSFCLELMHLVVEV